MRVTVVGDTTLDVIVRASATPTPGDDRTADIRAVPGGQGANVAVRLARRDVEVRLVTALADDPAGTLLTGHLATEGVEMVRLPATRSGMVVSLVDGGGERAMLSDRASLSAADLASVPVEEAVRDADWLHLSGYPLFDPATGAGLARLAGGRPGTCRCSVGGGSPAPRPGLADLVAAARPDILIVDRHEAAAILLGSSVPPATAAPPSAARGSATELGTALRDALGCVAVVTDGAAGATAVTAAWNITVPPAPMPGPTVDATGAGDSFAAALIASLAGGPWPPSRRALQDALGAAATAGAQAAGTVGAQARLPLEVS